LNSSLQRQIDFTTSPDVVSSDFVGNRHASIVDSTATIANDNRVVLYVWYDNEFGYACQVLRVLRRAAGISYPLVPAGIVV
ncbi:MAG: glyceraldehyde-3-phosphate dehydrogenase, partial [Pseudomonadales bacterium]